MPLRQIMAKPNHARRAIHKKSILRNADELLLRKGDQFVFFCSLHESYNILHGGFHIVGVPMGTHGLGFVGHIQDEQTVTFIELDDLPVGFAYNNRAINGVSVVQSPGSGQGQSVFIFQPVINRKYIVNRNTMERGDYPFLR